MIDTGVILEQSIVAARQAGAVLREKLGSLTQIEKKELADFVTDADRTSENLIVGIILKAFPEHTILAEESPERNRSGHQRWIIDPLDGTTNYIHSFPMFSVSIAYEEAGQIRVGVVFDPLKNELFHAVRGEGAYLNDRRLKVSQPGSLEDCLIATGFPFKQRGRIDPYLGAFKDIFVKVSDIRRAGSAALDLAYLAAGRVDGFWEIGLQPWDVAAGSLLIHEAGGVMSDFSGRSSGIWEGDIVAGSRAVQTELLQIVGRHLRPETTSSRGTT